MKHLTWILGSCLLLSTACSDDGVDPPDIDAMPMIDADPDQPDAPPPTYSHATDIQPIWDASCVTCHAQFLTAPAYETIVDVVSPQHGTMNRITPGNLDESYIWLKITDAHLAAGGQGTVMPPPPMPLLEQAQIDMIQTWIEEGAAP